MPDPKSGLIHRRRSLHYADLVLSVFMISEILFSSIQITAISIEPSRGIILESHHADGNV